MSNTKKQFVELVEFLTNNKDKKISTILSQVIEMTESKKKANAILYKEDGSPFAIFCFYHKQWELVDSVEYGAKKSSKSGLNTMCKLGTNAWTKQQSVAKQAKVDLLESVSKGHIEASELLTKLAEIETARNIISDINKPIGTIDEPLHRITL